MQNGPKKARRQQAVSRKKGQCKTDDLSALDAFCQDITLDEIAFEAWETHSEDLNLHVPLWLAETEAAAGGDRQVNFCRSHRQKLGDRPTREPASCLVSVPLSSRDGDTLIVKGQGDVLNGKAGDLLVTLRLRRS